MSSLSPEQVAAFKTFANELAEAARAEILPYWRKPIEVESKIEDERAVAESPVTIADRNAEKAMRALIEARFPEHGIYGEEFGSVRADAEFCWVLDPIDGTRNLMCDLRSAWTVVSFAPPGACTPRLRDVTLGIVSEIPDTRGGRYRRLLAHAGGTCAFEERDLTEDKLERARVLAAGTDARVDHGYFPIFRYSPDQRPALAHVEAGLSERLRVHEGANLRHFFDDQYISNAGQLFLLSIGTYRMIADVRGWLAGRLERPTVTSHPYDVAGAIVCARAAGCIVEGPLGAELDFKLDVVTPVSFVGFANAATAQRIRPHLDAAMRAESSAT